MFLDDYSCIFIIKGTRPKEQAWNEFLVDLMGVEPTTFRLQGGCSPK